MTYLINFSITNNLISLQNPYFDSKTLIIDFVKFKKQLYKKDINNFIIDISKQIDTNSSILFKDNIINNNTRGTIHSKELDLFFNSFNLTYINNFLNKDKKKELEID